MSGSFPATRARCESPKNLWDRPAFRRRIRKTYPPHFPPSATPRDLLEHSGITSVALNDEIPSLPYSFFNSTSSDKLCSSFTRTLQDSGSPCSRAQSPLTIDSYILVRPTTSSDFTVRISWSVYAAP